MKNTQRQFRMTGTVTRIPVQPGVGAEFGGVVDDRGLIRSPDIVLEHCAGQKVRVVVSLLTREPDGEAE